MLILGLDILGNPYQRLRDLSRGVKDLLYHPALVLLYIHLLMFVGLDRTLMSSL